ncbi:MAG: hypothetical protein M3526_02720 [Actinomycetota bacterium]|nr:hypothetical protein [Actinomycetota bacterium]
MIEASLRAVLEVDTQFKEVAPSIKIPPCGCLSRPVMKVADGALNIDAEPLFGGCPDG